MSSLDPDQKRDVGILLSHHRWGLFHQMGVGKSPPAIVAASQKLPCLITCPAYLIPQWEGYIEKWAPECAVGAPSSPQNLENRADFTLISYNRWNNDEFFQCINGMKWGSFVFDESHRLRNPKAKWSKRVISIGNRTSQHRSVPIWFLTGTPMVRDGGDIWTFLRLCDKQTFGGYWKFVEDFCRTTVTPWGTKVGEIRNPQAFQREILSTYSSRRVLKGVTHPVLIDIPVDLPKPLRSMIKKAKKEYWIEYPDERADEAVEAGGALWSKIRRWVTHTPFPEQPKLVALSSLIFDEIPTNRVIVWCYYKDSSRAIVDFLGKMGKERPIFVHNGDSSPKKRKEAIEGYKNKDDAILVATLSSLSLGQNLQEGHHQIFMEESTLPSENKQAVARQYRRGQKEAVIVHRIIARKSVDTDVRKLSSGRDRSITSVVQGYLRRDDD